MKKRIFTLLSIVIIFTFVLLGTRRVLAHGDEPRIEINPERLNSGAVLDIRGVDFEFEEEVELVLIGSQAEISLGKVVADPEGIFFLTVTLPVDLAEGAYVIRGTTDDHSVDSAALTIWGSAPLGEGGGRSEEDLLLAPMPTPAAGAPTSQLASVAEPKTKPAKSSAGPYIGVAVALGITWIIVLILRLRR